MEEGREKIEYQSNPASILEPASVVARLEALVASLSEAIVQGRVQLASLERASRLVSIGEVGLVVRRARETQGLTIAELAKLVGLSNTTVQQLEQGQGNPRLSTLVTVTAALGLKLWVE
jgi:DNA-binding XRE family transcriptional regulator